MSFVKWIKKTVAVGSPNLGVDQVRDQTEVKTRSPRKPLPSPVKNLHMCAKDLLCGLIIVMVSVGPGAIGLLLFE